MEKWPPSRCGSTPCAGSGLGHLKGMGWDGQHLGKTSRKFVFFVEKPRQNDMESCEVVLSFNVNVMCFISFVRVYMSILVKPCQLSGRCPLSPLKKKPAEFRVFDCYLKFRWWRKKPKQVRSQLPTTTHRKALVYFVSPPPHFQNQPSKTINPPPPPNFSK